MNKTLCFYNENAKDYFDKTISAKMGDKYNKFVKYLSAGSHILDMGCGSGRDSKYLLQAGYKITAIDGSKELCGLASQYIGQQVRNINFLDINDIGVYDAIWSCASLLHLERDDIPQVLNKMNTALKDDGTIYLSLKIGKDYTEYENGRLFTYYTEDSLSTLLKESNFNIVERWVSGDTLSRDNIKWINLILKKTNK